MALSKKSTKLITESVHRVFDKIKGRLLGRNYTNKNIYFEYAPKSLTIPGLYETASKESGGHPSPDTVDVFVRTADSFLEQERHRTIAHTIKEVDSFLRDAKSKGIQTDVETVLNGALAPVFGKLEENVKRIANTEATAARNMGALDGIVKANSYAGVDDPRIFFVIVRDGEVCEECVRLHMLDDKVTPRVWLLSQCGHGFHKKGDNFPSILGEHPNCRCTQETILPGYGFDSSGRVTFVAPGYDAYAAQQGE